MVTILEEAVRLFRRPITYRLLTKLEQANQRVAGAFINLSAWDGDDTALEFWAQAILRSRTDWRYLADVATLPLLEGNANWTGKESPVKYLAEATRNKMIDAFVVGLPRAEEVPLDEVPEPRAPDPAPADLLEKAIEDLLRDAPTEVRGYGRMVWEGCALEEGRRKRAGTRSARARPR
jgi:hypothetical protein